MRYATGNVARYMEERRGGGGGIDKYPDVRQGVGRSFDEIHHL
jgi:hypothetical protein